MGDGPLFEDARLNETIDFYKKWNGAANGRITGAFAPHAIYTCSPAYIKAISEAAKKMRLLFMCIWMKLWLNMKIA